MCVVRGGILFKKCLGVWPRTVALEIIVYSSPHLLVSAEVSLKEL